MEGISLLCNLRVSVLVVLLLINMMHLEREDHSWDQSVYWSGVSNITQVAIGCTGLVFSENID